MAEALRATRLARGKTEWLPTSLVWLSALLVSAFFLWILGDIAWHGAGKISWEFLTTEPEKAGRAGGIAPILTATFLILLVCMSIALPVGVGTAVLLSEYTSESSVFGRLVRRSLDVLAGIPSIVFGLFGNALFCQALGLGFSILSGGLTLACMVLPILIRATEEGFRSVPQDYRTASAALGMSRTSTLYHLLLPAATPGLAVGFVLGLGRAIAETAALIFTSGYVARQPHSLLDSGRSLSIHIYDLSMNVSGGNANAYATALVLVAILWATNLASSWLAERFLHRRIVIV